MSFDKDTSPNISPDNSVDRVDADLPDRILRSSEQCAFLGISPSQFYELQKKDPDFPDAIHLGGRARGRLYSDMLAYVKRKKEKTRGPSKAVDEAAPVKAQRPPAVGADSGAEVEPPSPGFEEWKRLHNARRVGGKS